MHVFLAGSSLNVAMLGPGAWSVDARLLEGRASMLMGEEVGRHTSKEAGMALYIEGHNRDRSGDASIAEKPDNPN